ncbi:bacteriohemerythrin [Gorillibacterium massiliense]|uniref:bacteriohemerythrin n=1 Tax=Gorillibacterium massiliense TaxID=1280390 RepID=UPI0004B95002|nr:bacteriohemerythrin [Gorillibacterium massiliense]
MITWREELNIGIDIVDEQHQELVRRMNEFMTACTQKQGKEVIEETLRFLASYVVEHFHDEEQLMARSQFPEYEQHREEHERFVADVNALLSQIETSGVSVLTTIKLNRTLVDWLINHIQKNDQTFGDYLKEKNFKA